MIIKEQQDAEEWNEFVAKNSSPSSFLQSWQWGEFQKSLGNKVYRLAVSEEGEILGAALVIVKPLPLSRTYLETPKGPIFKQSVVSSELLSCMVEELKRIGQRETAVLARVNPPYPAQNLALTTYVFTTPKILLRQMEPANTIVVDLSKSEDELLVNMHEKTRYNIRLAEKRVVKVRDATSEDETFEKFLDLLAETGKRDKITSWSKSRFYKFKKEFFVTPAMRLETPYARLLVGEWGGKILASAVVMLFGDAGTYLYAASSGEHREVNTPSLVLWEAIKLAKREGKKWYDMWGTAPKEAGEKHSWAGITRFKSRYVKVGETGKEIHPMGTYDVVLNKNFYTLFKLGKFLKFGR